MPHPLPGDLRPAYSRRLDRATILAALVHGRQRRKGTRVPYVTHPFAVALILDRHGLPADVVVAGVLHDVVEDLDVSDEAATDDIRAAFPTAPAAALGAEAYSKAFTSFIAAEFGQTVLDLVLAVTEEKVRDGVAVPWRERKDACLAALQTAPDNAVALKGADVLHNMCSILNDADRIGAAVFSRFRASPADTAWFYEQVAASVVRRLGPHTLAAELESVVEDFTAMMERLGAAGASARRGDPKGPST